MSSTTNAQSYLPYVFRPVYKWNSNTGSFYTQFNMSNIDTMTVNNARFSVIYTGDISNNVYIGSNAGNLPGVIVACNSASNTVIGVGAAAAILNSSSSEFVGFQTGSAGKSITSSIVMGAAAAIYSSNVFNSVIIGTSNSISLSNVSNTISIGGNAGGIGNSNIYIGTSTGVGMTGSCNVLIGHGINLATIPGYVLVDGITTNPSFSNASNLFMVGSDSKVLIAGNFSNGVVSIGSTNTNANAYNGSTNDPLTNVSLDVAKCIRVKDGLSIGCDPLRGYTLDVVGNFKISDGIGWIDMSNYAGGVQLAPLITMKAVGNAAIAGNTMTLNVIGQTRSSGYYTVQSGPSGVTFTGTVYTVSNVLKNNGLMMVVAYTTGATNRYNGSFIVYDYASGLYVSGGTPEFYGIAVSTLGTDVRFTLANATYTLYYNITFLSVG